MGNEMYIKIVWVGNISVMERSRALKSEKFGPTIEGQKKRDLKIKRKKESQKGRQMNS